MTLLVKCPMKYSIKTLMKPCLGGFLIYLLVMSPLGTGLILADVLADDCAECTQTERDQLRIRRAHQTALSLNDLLGELERLAHYPEAARLLLADHDEQLRNQLEGGPRGYSVGAVRRFFASLFRTRCFLTRRFVARADRRRALCRSSSPRQPDSVSIGRIINAITRLL